MNHSEHVNIIDPAVKTSLPISISGVYIFGISVPDWLLLFTLLYTIIQLFLLLEEHIPRWRKRYGSKDKR